MKRLALRGKAYLLFKYLLTLDQVRTANNVSDNA